MRHLYYIIISLLLVGLLFAGQKPIAPHARKAGHKVSVKVKKLVKPIEPIIPYAKYPVHQKKANDKKRLMKTSASATNVYVDRSGNGYGWLNSNTRKIDHWAGTDAQTGDPRDVVLLGYRGEMSDENGSARDICAAEVDVSAGLASGISGAYIYSGDDGTELNAGIDGIGGRYPSVTALEYPFVFFNQYISGDVQTVPAESHPYMITEYGTWLENGGGWTTPDFLMDDGWLDPDLNDLQLYKVNRLWNGAATVVKDAGGVYHWCGVYETWFSDPEQQNYNKQNHKNIMTAHSAADDPTSWTYGWDEGNDPVLIDPNVVSLPRCGVAMNSSGFGVIAGPGHLGWHDPDSGYYYNETRITYAVTYDYGVTWSDWDTVGMVEDLGIPGYIHGEDKWIVWDINGTDTTWYDGPAFVGTNFDMSVMVDDNNTIYVAFNSLWGAYPPGEDGWYPNYRYSGVLLARKPEGGAWVGSRIAYNNGIWQGDDYIEGMSNYFFDSECQISKDEQGNIYAAWLDRRHNQVQVSQFNRYDDPETYGSDATFKTDVYAAHSIDGGDSFSDPINCTDTPSLDEYELSMSIHSANQDARGDYGKIWYSYTLADTTVGDPATDAYIELPNDNYIGETSQFNEPAALEDEASVVRTYALEQNFPNPFNPTTTIEFVPLKSGKAQLTVYNTAGQQVAVLYDGQVTKNKPYRLTFDAHNLASGVYFYQLKMDNKTEIKKMVLVK